MVPHFRPRPVELTFSLLACIFAFGRRHTGAMLGIWLVVWTVLCLAACGWAFREIYTSTLEMWPNGYPG